MVRPRDERGATFVLTAICTVVLLWGGAMGVDLGFTVVGNRQAQAMADTAALDMARYINLAGSVSQANYNNYLSLKLANVKSDNGAGNVTFTVTGGYWNGTSFSTPVSGGGCYSQHLPLNPPCTAVKVTATQSVPQIFFGKSGSVARTTIASLNPADGFSLGSYPASFNLQQNGVLNDILSTLGSAASLSATSDAALANSYMTVQQLITASGGLLTMGNVLTTSLTGAQWLTILTAALNVEKLAANCGASPVPSVCTASAALGTLNFGGSASAKLCQLVTVNGTGCGTVTQAGLSANLDVLQTLTTLAEVANGTAPIDIQSALGITGISDSTLTLSLIQPPQIAYGPAGTTATSALVSAELKLTTGSGLIDIPLSAVQGTGSLNSGTSAAAVGCLQSNNSFADAVVMASSTSTSANVTLAGSSIGTLSISGASSQTHQFASTSVPPTATTQSSGANPFLFGGTPTTTVSVSPSSPVYTPLTTLGAALPAMLQAAGVPAGNVSAADLDFNCDAVSIVQ